MAALVQAAVSGPTGTTGSQTFSFPTTPGSGNQIVFWVSFRSATALQEIVLPAGVSWLTGQPVDLALMRAGWAALDAPADGSANSWLFDYIGDHKLTVAGFEMSDADLGSAVVSSGTSATASTAGVSHVPTDLILMGLSVLGATTATIPSPYVEDDSFDSTANGGARSIVYAANFDPSSGGTSDPDVTLSGSTDWIMGLLVMTDTAPPPAGQASVAGLPAPLTQESSASTTHPIALPTDRQATEIVVAVASCRGGGSGESIVFPAPWTRVLDERNVTAVALAWAPQSDLGSATVVNATTTDSRRVVGIAVRVTGADTAAPIAGIGSAPGTTKFPDPPNVAPAAGSDIYLWLAGFAIDADRITPGNVTNPSGFTTVGQAETQIHDINGLVFASREFTGASLDPGTFSGIEAETNNNWVAFNLAVTAAETEPPGSGDPVTVTSAPADTIWDAPGDPDSYTATVFSPPGDWVDDFVEPEPEPEPEVPGNPPSARVAQMSDWQVFAVHRAPSETGFPTFTQVGDALAFSALSWTRALNRADQISVSVSAQSLSDELKTMLKRPWLTPLELWVFRLGVPMVAGPVFPSTVQGGTVALNAGGVLDYLAGMTGTDNDFFFIEVDQADIARSLVDHYQVEPYGHFGIDTSEVVSVGVVRDRTYLASEHGVVSDLVANLATVFDGFDFSVRLELNGTNVDRYLQVHYPQKGRDLTDSVILDASSIVSSSVVFGVGPNDIASVAVVTGDSASEVPVRAEVVNSELLVTFGRWGATEVAGGVTNLSTATDHATELLAARDGRLFLPGPGLRSTSEVNPASIDTGDAVTYDYDDGLGRVLMEGRIAQIVTTVDAGGEQMTVQIG